jgi:capsular polysaccharide transport system permease protein
MSIGKAGLFWTFFEPFAQVLMFVLIRVAVMGGSGGDTSSYNFVIFMAVGFIAFNMFKHILSSSTGAFTANKGLFTYKQVKPIDTILARTLVEMFMTSIIVLIFLFVGFLLQYDIKAENYLLVAVGYFWLVIFSFSIGLIVGIGNTFYVSIGKFVGILSFLLMFSSAVFFPMESVPPEAQEILLYNPLVHFMEMIHANYISDLDDRFVDYIYMLKWTVTPLFIGMWLYLRLEKKIISI